jgi:hypothetical protein
MNTVTHTGTQVLPTRRFPSSFKQSPFAPSSLVRDGQISPHQPWLVVSQSTCPPLPPSSHANRIVISTAVINNNRFEKKCTFGHSRGGVLCSVWNGSDLFLNSSWSLGFSAPSTVWETGTPGGDLENKHSKHTQVNIMISFY